MEKGENPPKIYTSSVSVFVAGAAAAATDVTGNLLEVVELVLEAAVGGEQLGELGAGGLKVCVVRQRASLHVLEKRKLGGQRLQPARLSIQPRGCTVRSVGLAR